MRTKKDIMDFDLPEELQILRDTVRRFVDKELIPLEREYRHDAEGPMPERLLKPLQEKTKSMGLWMRVGLTKDLPLEWWYRQIRSTRITEGANEVLRWRLAQNLIRAQ
jgi:alkylation response protein AidB-like acyl-CoA dehydrogenase